jgi:hypothetical protein
MDAMVVINTEPAHTNLVPSAWAFFRPQLGRPTVPGLRFSRQLLQHCLLFSISDAVAILRIGFRM